MIVLDTDIMIDVLRKYPPALAWLASLGSTELLLPRTAWPSPSACDRALQDFVSFRLSHNLGLLDALIAHTAIELNAPLHTLWPSPSACDRALQDFVSFRLSHNLGLLDALIAHTAIELNAPLHTFNQKHYTAITALTTVQPYVKEELCLPYDIDERFDDATRRLGA
jgi:hypothetical protein